jgi:hypothetical protein
MRRLRTEEWNGSLLSSDITQDPGLIVHPFGRGTLFNKLPILIRTTIGAPLDVFCIISDGGPANIQ